MADVLPSSLSLAGEPHFDVQSANYSSMFLLTVRGSEGLSLLTLSGSSLEAPSGGKLRYTCVVSRMHESDPGRYRQN